MDRLQVVASTNADMLLLKEQEAQNKYTPAAQVYALQRTVMH